MRKILNASECLTVKRNETLRRKLRSILLDAIIEVEKIVFPRIANQLIIDARREILNTSSIESVKEVEPLGRYFDTLFAKLSDNDEVRLNYFTHPATMKLLEIRKVVPKR